MVNRKSLRVCRKSRKIPIVTLIIPFPNSVYPVFRLVNSGCNEFISRKKLRRKQKKNGKNLVNFGENRQKLSLFREETGKNLVCFGDNGKQPKYISGEDEQRKKKIIKDKRSNIITAVTTTMTTAHQLNGRLHGRTRVDR